MRTIGLEVLDRLHQQGVEHIFGIPGDYVIRFNKLIEEHAIQYVNATRENTAGYLADAYARVRGLGVACITYGVGINILNATSQAFVESSPLVIISGAAGKAEMEHGTLHHLLRTPAKGGFDATQLELFSKVTVDQARLNNPATAAQDIERVLSSCLAHKKPVYIELPRDQVDVPLQQGVSKINSSESDALALREALNETTRILTQSRAPLIWAGHHVMRRRLAPSLLSFAERHNLPIASTLLGKSVVSEWHPHFVGVYQGAMSMPHVKTFVEESDTALIFGVLFSDLDTGYYTERAGKQHRIIADPDRVTIGHHVYPNVRLEDFVQALSQIRLSPYQRSIPAWSAGVSSFQLCSAKITTKRLFDCLQSHLTPEHMLISDIGDCLFGALDLTLGQDAFVSGSFFASLGFSVPAAIAVQLAAPDKRVIALVGDGAFQMTAPELSTAVYNHLDPIIILLNNHGYGMERPLLEGRYNDIANWNYSEMPRLLGAGHGVRVTREEELNGALKRALATRGEFSLIEVELDKTDFSPAMHRFGALFGKTI